MPPYRPNFVAFRDGRWAVRWTRVVGLVLFAGLLYGFSYAACRLAGVAYPVQLVVVPIASNVVIWGGVVWVERRFATVFFDGQDDDGVGVYRFREHRAVPDDPDSTGETG